MPQTCERINKKLGLTSTKIWKEVKIPKNLTVKDNEMLFERLKLPNTSNI